MTSLSPASAASSHYVTSPSMMTSLGRYRVPHVTHIPDVCRHNVYNRCAVAPPPCVVGSTLGCDFGTCGLQFNRHIDAAYYDGLGSVYYDRLCELLDRQLELGTADRLCYVGEGNAARAVVTMLIERYCLVHPVVIVDPLAADGTETQQPRHDSATERQQSSNVEHRSLDDTFALRYSKFRTESRFDKIVVVDVLHYFLLAAERSPDVGATDHLTTAILQLMRPLSDDGRLLLIHRPTGLDSLPLPSTPLDSAVRAGRDVPLTRLVSTVESMGLVQQWSVERVPIVTTKRRWIDMVTAGFPDLSSNSIDTSIANNGGDAGNKSHHGERQEPDESGTETVKSSGQRSQRMSSIGELTTGVFRYAGNDTPVEFVDRLAFVTISRFNESRIRQQQKVLRMQGSVPSSKKSLAVGGLLDVDAESELGRYIEELRIRKENKPNLFR